MNSLVSSFKYPFAVCAMALLSVTALAAGVGDKPVELEGALEDFTESKQVLQQMRGDPEINMLLEQSEGVFVVPDYATAALIVGGAGGEGVLFPRTSGEWGHPLFYDIGSASLGLQAGAAAGSIAMILMSDEALESFKQENNFSLNAAAGLSIINWSARAEAKAFTGGDIIVWTDTEGLFGEVSVGISDINWDEEENAEFYGEVVTYDQILRGDIPAGKQEIGQVEYE